MKSLHERFDSYVEYEPNTGCWLWSGAAECYGYGRLKVAGVARKTHRLSYERYRGPIPPGLVVCHRCDTPACVNPDHLFLGTQADNLRDMFAKGRARPTGSSGERNGRAKLSNQEALEVARLRARGVPVKEVASTFGISASQVRWLARRAA